MHPWPTELTVRLCGLPIINGVFFAIKLVPDYQLCFITVTSCFIPRWFIWLLYTIQANKYTFLFEEETNFTDIIRLIKTSDRI